MNIIEEYQHTNKYSEKVINDFINDYKNSTKNEAFIEIAKAFPIECINVNVDLYNNELTSVQIFCYSLDFFQQFLSFFDGNDEKTRYAGYYIRKSLFYNIPDIPNEGNDFNNLIEFVLKCYHSLYQYENHDNKKLNSHLIEVIATKYFINIEELSHDANVYYSNYLNDYNYLYNYFLLKNEVSKAFFEKDYLKNKFGFDSLKELESYIRDNYNRDFKSLCDVMPFNKLEDLENEYCAIKNGEVYEYNPKIAVQRIEDITKNENKVTQLSLIEDILTDENQKKRSK